ncbi:MAG: hypothetical protein ED556_02360 [Winogradskyella sp.]|uniref:hypothetical protein n=1 Tax=Winogradskyella sp. TaxID=1883156 RepID=UPI000F3C5421|nr:hypothetical protein [Winogradskyella sp.]RNC88051.1 MAG: hypothetical protein ED556_02360 [Winogradskyella sp.]
MKIKLQIIFALLSILTIFNSYAQKRKGKITLIEEKKSLSFDGYVKIMANGNILFRETKRESGKEFKKDFIKRIEIYEGKQSGNYEFFKNPEDEKERILLIELAAGNITLFSQTSYGGGSPSFYSLGEPSTFSGTLGGSYMIIDYFVKEKTDSDIEYLTTFTGHKRTKRFFIEMLARFFSDCSDLKQKIKALEFEYDLTKIVNYYNNNCKKD